GGGIRSVDDARRLLRVGADKVSVNTSAVARPELISDIAEEFGAQCVVVAIDARQVEGGAGEGFTHGGRKPTGLDAVSWAAKRGCVVACGRSPYGLAEDLEAPLREFVGAADEEVIGTADRLELGRSPVRGGGPESSGREETIVLRGGDALGSRVAADHRLDHR